MNPAPAERLQHPEEHLEKPAARRIDDMTGAKVFRDSLLLQYFSYRRRRRPKQQVRWFMTPFIALRAEERKEKAAMPEFQFRHCGLFFSISSRAY
ncbi:hypothetical protein HH212_11575 [Massilia forsythiae]|uniref:Uncharacterized protein n=1 Tax=Massilia forsythiae TaxID=2728020 RepID=A0A7Z2ZSK5_9BURK|nr:hypothetical protein [Massilia forsythiae]QJE00581.1 hypothetical protein HH212_11575 [Massilia forsythiae]